MPRQRERHATDADFGKAIKKHAFAQAKEKNRDNVPGPEPITLDATITVAETNSWSICINLGPVSVCGDVSDWRGLF